MSEDAKVEKIVELANEAKAPGVFNILDAVKDRLYPKDDVVIYLDEGSAYKAALLKNKISEVQELVDGLVDVEENTSKIEKLTKEFDAVFAELEKSKYVFKVTGIPEGKREEAFTKAREEYPVEYEKNDNPFAQDAKVEKENPKRDRLLTNILWSYSIEKIISPDGAEQVTISVDDVENLRQALPASANIQINESIELLRAASAAFLMSVGEDFLAKS